MFQLNGNRSKMEEKSCQNERKANLIHGIPHRYQGYSSNDFAVFGATKLQLEEILSLFTLFH